MAEVVRRLGTDRTFVIHGDGVDELPLDGSGVAYIVAGDGIERHVIDAAALGFKRAATTRLAGGTPDENARMTEAVLRGEPGIRRDVVLLNAGAALLVAGVVEQMEEGIERAALTIDAGLGVELLEALRRDGGHERPAAAGPPKARRHDRRRPTRRRRARGRQARRRRGDRRPAPGRHPGRGRRRRAARRDRRALAAPAPRPIAERLAAPGLHLIAEIKRSSPSAGRIAAGR